MRDRSGWHAPLLEQLRAVWPEGVQSFEPGDMLDVELGLYLLETVTPTRAAADVWTLLGGYPYSEAFGDVRTDAQRLRIRRARHYLWDMRRRREWRLALENYQQVDQRLRGYDLIDIDQGPPQRRHPPRARNRFAHYEDLLTLPPAWERTLLPIAGAGEYRFQVREHRHSVRVPGDLIPRTAAPSHDLDGFPPGGAVPIEVAWGKLEAAAQEMDAIESAAPDGGKANGWADRLARVKLLVRDETEAAFRDSDTLRVEGLLNLVGMVGAGKSTLRDIVTYWAVTQNSRRVTIVVGDVAEVLSIVDQFTRLDVAAAPILGHSTRERNITRLHRRIDAATMLGHDHPGFAYLSSACPLDALRGIEAATPLAISQAPCGALYPAENATPSTASGLFSDGTQDNPHERRRSRPKRHGCPLWAVCPRHHGARRLVDAQVWVTTSAGLVHSSVPQHQHQEKLRYLELACRLSDLIVVDEADRVQMQLDTAFAPATTLLGQAPNSWLDEVAGHKLDELAREGRLQLSDREVDDWANAISTVSDAADRLYARLIRTPPLRAWITEDYFSALTLHQGLINAWFPDLQEPSSAPAPPGTTHEERVAARERVNRILDRFRDDPLEECQSEDQDLADAVNRLVHLALEILHAPRGSTARRRLREAVLDLVGRDPCVEADIDLHASRFELTLILAALHHRLNFVTTLWPRVEAALNLESTSNVLSRRPPRDYEPVLPESPMGNVLGFQFRLGERNRDGDQSGELRFFRCNGVGRELLLNLTELTAIDNRPRPNVLLMSATSWAGTSTRYHVHAPVGAVLRPHDNEVAAVLKTEFRKEFLYVPGSTVALRLSGTPQETRPLVLQQMLEQLAVPDRSLADSTSMLDQELADIDDPDRRRILLLVGSYVEAKNAAEYLNTIPEWTGRITLLVSDDADLDNTWTSLPPAAALRRGDIASFAHTNGEILVAPLLAVERGHNIVVPGGKAAIGSVYFLARPHPRPDDITLAIQAINDWSVRQVRGHDRAFTQAALAAGTLDQAGLAFRRRARKLWNHYLTRQLSWTSLAPEEKIAFTWDQLVVIWQVIGRLIRGGVAARVVFVDAAFSPREAGLQATDTPTTSLLASMRTVLEPYFTAESPQPAIDKSLVEALYEPLYRALTDMD
ncbi:pPIWI_RE_Z domain-containing protein [Nocardia terpenica]|uniref:Signal recognition particle n=1 Tax=Nocardia terpenica TaxID=455432 RepID=A0A291RID9_9NOCA|nr:signal recognition particle [Nocardia terpenica]ATL67371.1 signal recognition particle [Nocardia terpenica]